MEGFSAEDLSTIGGIATVSLLHSFIPTHWLPFSIVGRAQKWTLSRTLLVSTFSLSSRSTAFLCFFFSKKHFYEYFVCISQLLSFLGLLLIFSSFWFLGIGWIELLAKLSTKKRKNYSRTPKPCSFIYLCFLIISIIMLVFFCLFAHSCQAKNELTWAPFGVTDLKCGFWYID